MQEKPVASGLWTHKKRGSTYEVLHWAVKLQCANDRVVEEKFRDKLFTVYQDTKTREVYVRPTSEFLDGRFV